jgi:hypothetical protein
MLTRLGPTELHTIPQCSACFIRGYEVLAESTRWNTATLDKTYLCKWQHQ